MLFNEIEIGKVYTVHYIAKDNPCQCAHHNTSKKYITSCCNNMTFYGEAVCVIKSSRLELCFFAINEIQYFIIEPHYVDKLSCEYESNIPTKPWFDITKDLIDYAYSRMQ